MDGKTAICSQCAASFEYEPIIFDGREMFARTLCPTCSEIRSREMEQNGAALLREEREQRWHAVCPPLYRDTDPERINARCASFALEWIPGQRGLGITGSTGLGKTRALFLALRRAFDAGKTCRAISHNAFTRTVQSAFAGDGIERSDAKAMLSALQKCDVLMIDDLGKPPPTERADSELEEIVEIRTCNLLPILWSANGSSAWLTKRLGPDRGAPLVRRLSEFSDVLAL